jgi:hypothetical protein
MTSQDPCPLRHRGDTGQELPGRSDASNRRSRRRTNGGVSRAAGIRSAAEAEDGSATPSLRRRSGFSSHAITTRHRTNMGSHSPGCEVRFLVPDGKVNAPVLVEFPLAKALEVLIETGATFEHRLPQSPHHRNKDLIVSSVTNRQVESHSLRGWRPAFVNTRFMGLKNSLKLANLSICAPLTSKTGNFDLDDLPRLEQIASHTLIDRNVKGSKAPLVRRGLGNENALPMPDLDFTKQLKAMQSLTKGRAPDAQFRSQLTLRRNTSAFRQAANDVQKPLCDNLC